MLPNSERCVRLLIVTALPDIVTVSLNSAVDHVIEVRDFKAGLTVNGVLVGEQPAGKAVNVARVLDLLGTRCIVTGFVGSDRMNEFEKYLQEFGRVVVQLLRIRGNTRDNITIIDPVSEQQTHIRTEGFAVKEDDLTRLRSKLALLARPGVTMVFAGSLPRGMNANILADLLQMVARRGADLVLDSSSEALSVLGDVDLHILKVNRDEFRQITGKDFEEPQRILEEAEILVNKSIADQVVVTLDNQGAVLAGKGFSLYGKVKVDQGRIVNAVGCGDSFLAGLLHSRDQGHGWKTALRDALAVATANAVSRMTAFIETEVVAEFVDSVDIQTL